jgi:hypothetical protein
MRLCSQMLEPPSSCTGSMLADAGAPTVLALASAAVMLADSVMPLINCLVDDVTFSEVQIVSPVE